VALPSIVLGLQRFHQPPSWEAAAAEGGQPEGYRFPSSRMYPPASEVGFTVPELRNPADRWYFPAPAELGYPASDLRPHYGDYEAARPVQKKKMNLAEFLFNRLNDKNRRKPLKVKKM
jgi:hypothetical protein